MKCPQKNLKGSDVLFMMEKDTFMCSSIDTAKKYLKRPHSFSSAWSSRLWAYRTWRLRQSCQLLGCLLKVCPNMHIVTPRAYSNSSALSWWSHPISSSILLLLPSIFPSIRVFSNGSAFRIRWPKYWNFSFSPSNEYSGWIFFSIDWLDLCAVQGTLKSLLQHHSWKASTLRSSASFMVQHSHPYMTTGKTIALTRWTFVGKVMSLLFNMLPRFVIAFLPRSKNLLVSWLRSASAVILELKKRKSATISTVSPSICHERMGLDAMILVFWMLSFKPAISLSSFTFIKRFFSSSLSAIRVVSSAYLKLLIFLAAILIPACASSIPAFHMIYTAYKLNNQGDNI